MRPRGTQARIVGRRNHGPLLDQFSQSGHLLENKDRKRGRTMRHDSGGRMRPGNDRPAAGRRRARRNDDDAGNRDGFAAETSRAVEYAIGLRAGWREQHWLGADDRAGRAGHFLRRYLIERRLCMRRAGRQPECQRAEQRTGTTGHARNSGFNFHRSQHDALSWCCDRRGWRPISGRRTRSALDDLVREQRRDEGDTDQTAKKNHVSHSFDLKTQPGSI